MNYKEFTVSIYCPVGNLTAIASIEEFDLKFSRMLEKVNIEKVYLETYRSGVTIEKAQMLRIKEYFLSKEIKVAGGITTDDVYDPSEGGFSPFCYTSEAVRRKLENIVIMTSELFDEFILDDFFFTNCRCEQCIEAKGNRSWQDFRLDLMKEISEEVIVKPAKRANPDCRPIIKFPNWYEHFQEAGYNLEEEPKIFDSIYTGTETRNPTYTQQHLPKYLSYFIMRYFEHIAPGRNLGGWFDPYECTYNLTSYLEQGYLTLFAKAKEAMLFSLGSLLNDAAFSVFPAAVGQMFEDMDGMMKKLGEPIGVPCYLPYHGHGEDYLHNYIGMCGIPLDPYPDYPKMASTVFLTQNAAKDTDLVGKIKKSLCNGADVIVTSGLVCQLGSAFHELAHVTYQGQKMYVNTFMVSENGGVSMEGSVEAAEKILFPVPQMFTNDVWQIAGGYGIDNNSPILMKTKYAKGRLFIVSIPDDQGQLYQLPAPLLNVLRRVFTSKLSVILEGPSKVAMFLYDNRTLILRSFLPYSVACRLLFPDGPVSILVNNKQIEATNNRPEKETSLSLVLHPGVNYLVEF